MTLMKSKKPILMGAFTKSVIFLTKQVPRGKVASYGQIASLAGKPHGARGVGWILNSCAETHDLPWQRIINSKGKISFSKRTDQYRKQKALLIREKIKFLKDDSISLDAYGWKKTPKRKKSSSRMPKMFD